MTIEPDAGQRRYVHFMQDGQPKKRPATSTSAQHFGNLDDSVDLQTRELLLAAHYSQTDLVITTGVTAEELPSNIVTNLDILTPDLALPVIGLYLRTQGRFVFGNLRILGGQAPQGSISRQSRHIFYWEVAQILLPQLPVVKTLATTIPESDRKPRWDSSSLCQSLVWRVEQILRSRDRLLSVAFSVPIDQGPTDEIASEVDTIMLYSMSVLDITARLAEVLFPTKAKVSPGWQSKEWLGKLKQYAPQTAEMFDESSPGHTFMRILTRLRNTIHAEAFSAASITYIVGPYRFQPLVLLPAELAESLQGLFKQLGGSQGWGFVEADQAQDRFIHLGVLAERLCKETFRLSNSILKMLVEDARVNHGSLPGVPHERPLSVPNMRALLQAGLLEYAGSPFRDEPVALDEQGMTMIRIKKF